MYNKLDTLTKFLRRSVDHAHDIQSTDAEYDVDPHMRAFDVVTLDGSNKRFSVVVSDDELKEED